MNKKLLIIVLTVFVGCVIYILWPQAKVNANLDAFAQCLADKGVTMYGAEWCPHCKDQKKMFGDSWKIVPYVECPENTSLCLAKGIEGYPTWLIGTSTRLVGTQSIEKLSDATACPVSLEKPSR